MIVLGLDPSLRNFGFSRADLNVNTGELSDVQVFLHSTASSKHKQVRKNSDDLERCRSTHKALKAAVDDADMVFVEVPVGSQSARAMASYGFCIGILASIEKPVIQLTPTEIKKAATGSANATKQEMIEWAVGEYPGAGWLRSGKKERLINDNEHMADATAAIKAGLESDLYKQATAVLKWAS